MKKILFIIISFILLIPTTTNALVKQWDNLYITDDANILTSETIEQIYTYSSFLREQDNIYYCVVTVSSLEGINIEEYADYIFESYNLGKKGILIFIAEEDRSVQVIVGSSLSRIIDNTTIDNYIKEFFVPYIKEDEWDKGIKNGYNAFFKLICNAYNIDSSTVELSNGEEILFKYRYPLLLIIIWLETLICTVFTKYFRNIFRRNTIDLSEHFFFVLTLFINILLIVFTYNIKPIYILIVIAYELLVIWNLYNQPIRKRLKKKNHKKRKPKKK